MSNTELQNQIKDISRRRYIATLLALGVSSQLPSSTFAANQKPEFLISAQGSEQDTYSASWFNARSKQLSSSLSGFRGHGMSQHPLRRTSVIMFGRRPSTSAIEVNLLNGQVENDFHCAKNRHLFGHGCFSQDGKSLFTPEAEISTGLGKIVIRDASNYKRLGEYDSHGIGPHEIGLMPDGKTLVIANGGIRTHPDTGREKLNLDSMDSRLTYIDLANGQQIDAFKVHETKASIRHLYIATDGTVAIAMQLQRKATDHFNIVPLAAIHKPGMPIALFQKPSHLIERLNDYLGSVVINNSTRIAGFTSPRGNLAIFWHIDDQNLIAYHSLQDVCGIAVSADQKRFIISNSMGHIRKLDATTLAEYKEERLYFPGVRWDNHLLMAIT